MPSLIFLVFFYIYYWPHTLFNALSIISKYQITFQIVRKWCIISLVPCYSFLVAGFWFSIKTVWSNGSGGYRRLLAPVDRKPFGGQHNMNPNYLSIAPFNASIVNVPVEFVSNGRWELHSSKCTWAAFRYATAARSHQSSSSNFSPFFIFLPISHRTE